jgi:hypothetical protein
MLKVTLRDKETKKYIKLIEKENMIKDSKQCRRKWLELWKECFINAYKWQANFCNPIV